MDEKALGRASSYIKSWFRYHYERGDTPGFVVAIAHKGKIIFNEAYGYANLENRKKMTTRHLFRIASHSKTFTATAVMQLQEQGKLRIDDSVAGYLPWLKKHTDKRWQNVTIRQLMSHGAGVIRDGKDASYWNVEQSFPSQQQFKKEILEAELVINNNTKLKYSNYGYTLLGMLITEVSGQPYNQYVTEKIIKPLGLDNTGPEFDENIESQYVTGYSRLDDKKKRLPIIHINTNVMSAATGFYSTAENLCSYFTAHMIGSGQLLNDESKKEMQRVHWSAENIRDKTDYGLGLDIEYVNDHRLLGHGGGFPGNITKSYFDPKNELVVIVLTNANGSWAGYIDRSMIKVIDFFQKDDTKPPKWQKYEGRYSDLWWDVDIIAFGDKLIAASADSWEPFDEPTELEHVRTDTFKITKTDSFSSLEEPVEFKLDQSGKVQSVIYAGTTMFPEYDYLKKLSQKKRIG